MINPNELRIGNWVNDSKGFLYQIKKSNFENTDFSITTPIPLTPEILEKCGFAKDRTGFSLLDKMSLSFSVDKSGRYIACWEDKSLHLPYELNYLHQLQNLYWCLCGEELNYQP